MGKYFPQKSAALAVVPRLDLLWLGDSPELCPPLEHWFKQSIEPRFRLLLNHKMSLCVPRFRLQRTTNSKPRFRPFVLST